MFLNNIKEQVYALAGLHQACVVVSDLAWRGDYNDKNFKSLINCIVDTKSTKIENIFVEKDFLETGFKHLKKQIIDDIFTRSSETRRYISSIESLVNKLGASKKVTLDIGKNIEQLNQSLFKLSVDDQTKMISSVYQSTLSKIEPRIIVSGKNEFLKQEYISTRIRTALFAGVRCVYLYREYGGNKIKFFLFKKNYIKVLKELLNIS